MHLLKDSDLSGMPKKLINRKQLLKIIPLSERTIFDMEKRGEFPRRFALTVRNVAWDLDEIQAWIQQRKERASAGYPRGLGLS